MIKKRKKIKKVKKVKPKRPYNVTLTQAFIAIIVIGVVSEFLLSGQLLIRNHKIKATINQIQKYKTSITVFQKKYGELPGDINKTVIYGLSERDTDGNMNGIIEDMIGVRFRKYGSVQKASGEVTNFWMHLGNSGLLDEKYDGESGLDATVGQTFPRSTIDGVGITAYGHDGSNYLQIGVKGANNKGIIMTDNSLKPIEAFILDKKTDDGHPRSGEMIAVGGREVNGAESVNKNCATKREYLVKANERFCQIRINIE